MVSGKDEIYERLNDIVSDWMGCTDCDLCKRRTQQVWLRIEGEPRINGIMLIGEAPGADEDKEGTPFVGKAGAKLNRLLIDANIDSIFITNTVMCRPPGNRNPTKYEMRACWPRLQRMIEIMKPSVIITVGNIPSHWILENDKSMRSLSEKIYNWRLGNILSAKVVPTYHPSFLLRQKSASLDRTVINRLKLAKGLVSK